MASRMEGEGSFMTCRWVFFAMVLFALFPVAAAYGSGECNDLSNNQTSASLLIEHSKCQRAAAPPEAAAEAEKRHLLLLDIYIKARSYAILNKVFF